MKTSEKTGELLTSLLKARTQFQPIVRSAHVTVTTKAGRKYDFDYAPLEVIQAAIESAMSAESLVLVSAVQPGPDVTVEVVTRLLHTSEQWFESCIPSGPLEDVKALGGFVSYARRYNTLALLDLSAEDDLDGSQAIGDHIEPRAKAVAPVTAAAAENLRPSEPINGHCNGHTPAPQPEPSEAPEHPTEGHLAALRNLALTECGEELEVYEQRIQQTMKIPAHASVVSRLLTRTMSMPQYMELFAYYRRLESQLAKRKETARRTVAEDVPASEPAPATAAEGLPVDPSPAASSSAPAPNPDDAAERDRARLRKEVASWDLRVSPEEIEHVIQHHPYSKAGQLHWKARRPAADAMPMEAAAD